VATCETTVVVMLKTEEAGWEERDENQSSIAKKGADEFDPLSARMPCRAFYRTWA